MRPRHDSPQPVSPLTAHKTWRTLEPLHGLVYFAPESTEAFARLGLTGQRAYFASRSAAMGRVGPGTVAATFYNFDPDLVRRSMDGVWDLTDPATVLEARSVAAGSALRRILGPTADSPELVRAASLARRAADRAGTWTCGRPLFAGHADQPWPEEHLRVLWHAQTLLREFRGDGHIAVLVGHELGPVEALVLHEAFDDLPTAFLRTTRGWPDHEWEAATARLVERGWLRPPPSAGPAVLTEEGASVRRQIEEVTDRLSVPAYEALGEDGCAELRALVRPASRAVVASPEFPG